MVKELWLVGTDIGYLHARYLSCGWNEMHLCSCGAHPGKSTQSLLRPEDKRSWRAERREERALTLRVGGQEAVEQGEGPAHGQGIEGAYIGHCGRLCVPAPGELDIYAQH